MTWEVVEVLAVLAVAVFLFVSEKIRVDLVAILVLVTLAVLGLVTPEQAVAGFSSPAVVTVWAVFILSGGLQRTGIAGMVGRQILRVAGHGEARLIAVIMASSAFLSAFMNNVGVAALLLPVVMDISRRTKIAPSKLLIPLAFSSLMGGLTTQIGTPPNILISGAAEGYGMEPFELFDFAPVGLAVNIVGILFMVLIGRRLLPTRQSSVAGVAADDVSSAYELEKGLCVVTVPEGSMLAGKTLAESRVGSALGVHVLAIERAGHSRLAPGAHTEIRARDRLLVEGSRKRMAELDGRSSLVPEQGEVDITSLVSGGVEVAEVGMTPGSELLGKTLKEVGFRQKFGVIVLALRRGDSVIQTRVAQHPLQLEDVLLLWGPEEAINTLRQDPDFIGSGIQVTERYHLEERLMLVRVPEDSVLAGVPLRQSRLGDAFELGVLGIVRDGKTKLVPRAKDELRGGDVLIVKGRSEDVEAIEGLAELRLGEEAPPPEELESEDIGFAEVVVSPRATIAGKTLQELNFREKYDLNVVALSREGVTQRQDLRTVPLQFGDGLLVHGPRGKLRLLGSEKDFLVLAADAQEPVRRDKAPIAAALMLAVVGSVLMGWLPIYVAAIAGAALMVLSRCLTMEEAYGFIDWRAVFLIAGMLPLGAAMESTGVAQLAADAVVGTIGSWGELPLIGALFLMTAAGAQVMPTSAVAILMAPIAFNTASELGLSPHALMMTVSLSASASFMSPVAHPANVLIMSPGGYRFVDYIRVGLPLTLVCLTTVLLLLPWVWPL